ncbi:MAG: Holliday junction resolvase RuvX [Prevotellaceae bacterium]|jgi:putative Holliday junction resolvase|nr:Holliday junction resolvase RuvX [Prevotellaceae bacterium]
MGRILAIDYGKKRIGIAVTDPLQLIANGLETVSPDTVFDFLQQYVEKEIVDKIIVGLPKQMNGKDAETMQYIRPFVDKLQKKIPEMKIEFIDERFTSVLAHKAMIDGGLKKKDRQNKALVDKISATIILQTYLEQKNNNPKLPRA